MKGKSELFKDSPTPAQSPHTPLSHAQVPSLRGHSPPLSERPPGASPRGLQHPALAIGHPHWHGRHWVSSQLPTNSMGDLPQAARSSGFLSSAVESNKPWRFGQGKAPARTSNTLFLNRIWQIFIGICRLLMLFVLHGVSGQKPRVQAHKPGITFLQGDFGGLAKGRRHPPAPRVRGRRLRTVGAHPAVSSGRALDSPTCLNTPTRSLPFRESFHLSILLQVAIRSSTC